MRYIELNKDVRWSIIPRDDGRWDLRKNWRYKTRWDAPDDKWRRSYVSIHDSLSDVFSKLAEDYRDGVIPERAYSLQVKLGPTVIDCEGTISMEKKRS